MAKRDILKEAIADAKAVKAVALENAKAALEEAFTPHLKDMLSAKINEMEEDDKMEEMMSKSYEEDDMKEGMDSKYEEDDKMEEMMSKSYEEDDDKMEEEINLDEILAELEKETLNEAEEEVETEEEVEVEDETETEEESVEIEDMTDDELKTFIEDVISDMVAAGELEAGESFEAEGEEVEVDDDEELDIEIEDDETEEVEIAENNENFEALNEKLKHEIKAKANAIAEIKRLRRGLKEAHATIETQGSALNEVKLLNSKLLYTNKIFKAKSLTENEKVKVLSSFDKATTIKEAKLIFETLSEGLKSKRKPIKESLGSASKVTGNFKNTKKPIIASDPMVSRFQKLAGLK